MLLSGAFGYLADYALWWLLYLSLIVHTWCFFKLTVRRATASVAPGRGKKRMRLVVGNLLLTLCALGTLAMAGETYLRFISVETDAFGMSLPARRWFAMYTELNALDCRDKEWSPEKPPGVYRIAFVGDSFTYGWGIKDPSDRFTELIQKRFDASAPGTVEVLNVAKPGWGTKGQVQPIAYMIEVFDVDEIVLAYLPNDIEQVLPTTDDFNPRVPPEPTLFDLDRSCLIDYLYRRLIIPREPTVRYYHDWLADGYATPETWKLQQRVLGEIFGICHNTDTKLTVALLPFLATGGEKFDAQGLHALLAGFCTTNHVPVVDLLPCLSNQNVSDLLVSRFDPHPNEKAHALFAEKLWTDLFADR